MKVMAHRLTALLLTLIFAGHALAGSSVCVPKSHTPGCESACCQEAHSAAAVAKLCCETVCGRPANHGQSAPPDRVQLPAPTLTVIQFTKLDSPETASAFVALKSVEVSLLQHRSPPLFLSHSALLI